MLALPLFDVEGETGMITVYTARSIITMNQSWPRTTAVAIRDGHIIETGSLESMQPWLKRHPHTVDTRFEDCVITPGFIDPHLHPSMAAVILPMTFITAMEWRLPWGIAPACTTAAAFDERLRKLAGAATEPLITWGHHELWHGDMSRSRINSIEATKPVIVWNRSFHELCMNDGALNWLGITEDDVATRKQIDWDKGRFYEVGLGYALKKLNPYILADDRFKAGLERLAQVVHLGGHTTIGDLAVGMFEFDKEVRAQQDVFEHDDNPFRVELVPHAAIVQSGREKKETLNFLASLPETNSHHLRFARRIKLFADGAFFSQIAQLMPPGYIDGHHGEWLQTPEILEENIRTYWHENYTIHVHVTGDLGVELTLDILEKMQQEKPRFHHGFTLEHFGYSTPEQIHRAAKLGASISANVYYLHELSAIYARDSVGMERAASMARVGTAMREGITTTLHSDFTMAPAHPLTSMWVAVNRINAEGDVMCEAECLTPEQALGAITINAARVLGLDHEIGSIRAGKKADFTVLRDDPLTVDPMTIRDIEVVATVFEGKPFPVQSLGNQ